MLEATFSSSEWHLRQQLPVTLDESEPEPDVAIVRGQVDDYRERHPLASECDVLIEIADSSLEYDRAIKGAIYAAGGIRAYWIVNVRDESIEAYGAALVAEKRFATRRVYRRSETLTLELGPAVGLALAVDSVFG